MTTTPPVAAKKTLVQTAEGDVIQFGDFFSKFAAAHPKTAAIIIAVAFNLIGVLFHL